MRRRLILRLAALSLIVTQSSCARLPERPAIAAAVAAGATVPGYGDIRHWADAPAAEWQRWRARWIADRAAAGHRAAPHVLAISSGSDKGAFAAGYLTGWSESGHRPDFDLVTGVSTGALIAPFALLGRGEDPALRALYTGVTARQIFRGRALSGLLGGPSFADSRPLAALIARYVYARLVDRIAAAHRSGKRLLVMTTNLDAGRGMMWDMGAIAASGAPDRVALFRRILLASASIPGFFPPAFVGVASGQVRFSELHVDGGTTASVFVVPPAILWGDATDQAGTAPRSMTLLYNGKLDAEYAVVRPRALTILARALSTVLTESDRRAIAAYRQFADARRVPLTVAAIAGDFDTPSRGLFDQAYMRALFAHGAAQGRAR